MNAIALGSSAFAYGALSSVGPCAAPRLLAFAALGALGRNRWTGGAAFVAGSTVSYAAFGAAGNSLASAISSPPLYWLLAAACACGAAFALTANRERACCSSRAARSRSAEFVSGCAATLSGAGCCAPIALVLAQASAVGGPVWGAATLSCFALGQGLPTLAVAAGWSKIADLATSHAAPVVVGTIGCGILLALSGYYALLA